MNKSNNGLNFVVKVSRNFVLVPAVHAILLPMMRYGFLIGRLVTSQQMAVGLVKVDQQQLFGVEVNFFSVYFKSNGPVLIHGIDEDKTVGHNYYMENRLKPVANEIWKQRRSNDTKGRKPLDDNA